MLTWKALLKQPAAQTNCGRVDISRGCTLATEILLEDRDPLNVEFSFQRQESEGDATRAFTLRIPASSLPGYSSDWQSMDISELLYKSLFQKLRKIVTFFWEKMTISSSQ